MSAEDAKLATLRAQVHAELARAPRATPWWVGAAVLVGLNLAAAAGALLVLSSNAAMSSHSQLRWAIAGGLLIIIAAGSVLGLRPGRQAPRVALMVVAGAVFALAWLLGAEARPEMPFWAGTSCATTECLVSMVPLVTGLLLLTRFGFDPLRTALVGMSSAGVGLLALHLHCGNGAWGHVAMFHALPCAVMVGALLIVRRAMPSKTFAP